MPLSKNRLYRYPDSQAGPDLAAHLAALAEDVDADMEAAAHQSTDTVLRTLEAEGIMRGHASIPVRAADSVWRQTTEDGGFLPLGYNAQGGLDSFARSVWKEEVNGSQEIPLHPVYSRAAVTEDGSILWALRWDGMVEIPGLVGGGGASSTVCLDAPWTPGSDVVPPVANSRAWAMWSSSSGAGIAGNLRAEAAANGATYYNGGQGGEQSPQIAARLGSIPALLVFPGNQIPASGAVEVRSSNLKSGNSYLKAYKGRLVTEDGRTVSGTLSGSSGDVLTFTRTGSGTAAAVGAEVAFIPDDGQAHRADLTFLWMGKNNVQETARVIRETAASFDYLVPLVKRCLVLGHFVDTGTAADAPVRSQIREINAAYARRYGAAYVDIDGYLTGSQVWKDTGITPTDVDLWEQELGNKPPSLSTDNLHMNAAAYAAVLRLIHDRLTTLGWI